MAYDSIWVRLNVAVTRVMDSTGCSKEEAQAEICRAVYERAIRFQAKLKQQQASGGMTSTSIRAGMDFEFQKAIKPADLDWEESRPLKPWFVGRDKYQPAGFWILDWIELSRADVDSVLCASGQASGTVPPPAAKTNARPKIQAARRAIQALYPDGPPDQVALPNKELAWRVGIKLKELGLPAVKPDTIFRAAGRRRK